MDGTQCQLPARDTEACCSAQSRTPRRQPRTRSYAPGADATASSRTGGEVWWVRQIARNEALRQLARRARTRDLYTEADAELLEAVPAGQDVSLLAEIIDLRRPSRSWRQQMPFSYGYVMSGT